MAVDLLRSVAEQIQVGAPLPFGVRDEQGKLLLAKGRVVANESQRQILIERDPDIAICHPVRQDPKRMSLYGLSHALHCALVCPLAATRAGWPPEWVRTLLKAALTMNLSIVEVQGRFATLGRLNDPQRDQIRAHPHAAVERLQAAGVTDPIRLQAVLEHQERPGGGGYPHNRGDWCHEAAVLRMADVFMAKISPRTDRPALPILDAARQMFAQAQGSPLAAAIIKEYGIHPPGIHPPGNFVQLASGEMAVVIRRGATAHTPVAAAVTDRIAMPVVRTTRRNTAEAAYAIKSRVPESKMMMRMPPERLYGLVVWC